MADKNPQTVTTGGIQDMLHEFFLDEKTFRNLPQPVQDSMLNGWMAQHATDPRYAGPSLAPGVVPQAQTSEGKQATQEAAVAPRDALPPGFEQMFGMDSGDALANLEQLSGSETVLRYGGGGIYPQQYYDLLRKANTTTDDVWALKHYDAMRNIQKINQPETVAQLFKEFINAPEALVKHYQERLVKAGLLNKKSMGGVGNVYRPGLADPNTLKGMRYVYWWANKRNMSVSDALADLEKHPFTDSPTSGGGGASASEMAKDEYRASLVGAYQRIWGLGAPPGYVEKAMAANMNLFEFEANEKNKPGYAHSPGYQYDRMSLQERIARELGSLG